MILLRGLGRLFLFVAFAAAALDGARALATPAAGFHLASMTDHMTAFQPEALSEVQAVFTAYLPPLFWTSVVEPLLILPMTMVFSALGIVFFWAGYKKPPLEVPL